jgi:hypothetical protein
MIEQKTDFRIRFVGFLSACMNRSRP